MSIDDIDLNWESATWINKITNNEDIENQIKDVLLKVDKVLELWWIDIIKKYFELNWLKNYYDFYFLKIEDFKDILSKSDKLVNFYKNKTWESFSHISSKSILYFAEFLWFEKLNYSEVKFYISSELSKIWINSENEFSVLSINNFISKFSEDKIFKYFFMRVLKTSIHNISQENYNLFSTKIWLKKYSEVEVNNILKEKLKNKKIIYLDDLETFLVRDFIDYVWTDLLLEYYFNNKWIYKSFIKKEDILNFWIELWLKNNNLDDKNEIKKFLFSNQINSYDDLKDYHKTDIRSILWENPICRKILNWFWLTHLKDYRLDHLKRFARFVWLPWVPKDFELDDVKSKNLILKRLESNGVTCIYSLKLNWIKWFKRIFKESIIWKIYIDVNSYIKNNIWKTIVNLSYDDLDSVWFLLWLPFLSDEEHKRKFLYFLSLNSIELDTLNKSKVKNDRDFWRNPNFRYLLDQIWWPTDIKLLRPNHIDDLKNFIKEI